LLLSARLVAVTSQSRGISVVRAGGCGITHDDTQETVTTATLLCGFYAR